MFYKLSMLLVLVCILCFGLELFIPDPTFILSKVAFIIILLALWCAMMPLFWD